MSHDFPLENNETEEGPCNNCTDSCDNCSLNNEFLDFLSRNSANDTPNEVAENPEESFLPSPVPTPLDQKTVLLDFIADSNSAKHRGRPKKEIDPSVIKRKRGGQPGNLNALKHGLYVEGNAIYNTTPMERAKLFDINGAINHIKDYMDTTFDNGQKLKKTIEINDTMKTLACAAIALSRLIGSHNEHCVSSLPYDLYEEDCNTPLEKIEDYYYNKIEFLKDDSENDPQPDVTAQQEE